MNNLRDRILIPAPELRGRRSRSVQITGVLLLVQALGLASISFLRSTLINWPRALGGGMLTDESIDAVISGGAFGTLAIAGVLAGVGLLFRLRTGWLIAMVVQVLMLLACLYLYVQHKPTFIYPVMLSGIVVVLYLNSFDVRVAFNVKPATRQTEPVDEP